MKLQEVILRALAKKITWEQAAEIIGISDRQMRRWKQRYEEFGYDGLFDRRLVDLRAKLIEEKRGKDRKRIQSGFPAFQPAGLSRSPKHQPLGKRGSLRSTRFPRPNTTTKPPTPNQNRTLHVL